MQFTVSLSHTHTVLSQAHTHSPALFKFPQISLYMQQGMQVFVSHEYMGRWWGGVCAHDGVTSPFVPTLPSEVSAAHCLQSSTRTTPDFSGMLGVDSLSANTTHTFFPWRSKTRSSRLQTYLSQLREKTFCNIAYKFPYRKRGRCLREHAHMQ